MTPAVASESIGAKLDLDQIQGNIAGFNKDHQRLVYLIFSDSASGRAFLGEIVDDIATCEEVGDFNALFKAVNGRRHGEERGTVESTWLNIALTITGLEAVDANGVDGLAPEFREGMAARAEAIGDVEDSAPQTWVDPFQGTVHAVAIIGSDSPAGLEAEYEHLQKHLRQHDVTELGIQDGAVRPGNESGHEHFGFKDGISQPGISGLTTEEIPGQDILAAGEFILGYPKQGKGEGGSDGESGTSPEQSAGSGSPVAEGGSGYSEPTPSPPAPTPPSLPPWAKNGSYLVIRRLRQNVPAFKEFVSSEAERLKLSTDVLGAKLVGRYKSGAPIELTKDQPQAGFDPTKEDPSGADPSILEDKKINNFDYAPQDVDGHFMPRAAHIRKTYPRNQDPPTEDGSNVRRILRRGIPYGPELAQGETAYQAGQEVSPDRDRGLVFACYQASIAEQFEFIQEQWVNRPDFPQGGDGSDPIISQNEEAAKFDLPPSGKLTLARWVITTGGGYFFSPSIDALKAMAAGTG